MQLKVCENDDGKIKVIGVKEFKPVTYQASKWVREEVSKLKTFDVSQTTNGIDIVDNAKSMCGSLTSNAIGYFHNNANSPYYNAQFVGLYSTAFSCGHGLSITPENFKKVCALFTARKTIKSTWINQKDEYSAPNTGHVDYKQWNNDAIIYSLFHSSSRQSSLRDVHYKEKIYQIKNEFFFMSKDEMKGLADKISYTELYNDVKFEQSERCVYTLLMWMSLSDDARHVLESARSLVRETMLQRADYNQEHPELQLNSWDAGYVQLKGLWKEVRPEKFKKFREDYLMFEKRMREGVYKFGFLEPDFSTMIEVIEE